MPTVSTTQDGRKRRLRNACDMCYKRKVKCDSAEKSDHWCTNCVVAGIQCTHARARSRTTPLDSKSGQQHVAEILSTSTVYIPDRDPTLSHRVLVQVAQYARELEQTIATLTYNTSPESDPEESSTATEDVLSDAYFRALTISDDSEGTPAVQSQRSHRFHGKSSNIEFVRSAMRYMDGNNFIHAIQRPTYWITPPWEKLVTTAPLLFFPDDDLLVSLVQLYFAQVNPIFPILHSRSFQDSIANGLHFRDPDFGAVVLAVCSVGSRFSDDPRVFIGSERVEHSCGWKWFRQIRNPRMGANSESTWSSSLHRLQLIALSVLYLSGLSQTEETWILTGLGVRLAQGVGAHLRGKYNSSHVDPIERELYKRVFWMLVAEDVLTSVFKGRPRIIHDIDLDIDLPVDMADEYWGVPPTHRSTGTPSNSEFFTAFVRLIQIYGRIQREIYPADGSMCKPSKVLELDSELNSWVDSVPERLRWDPNQENQILLDQSAAIYAVYYHAQILIHRRFIPTPGKLAARTSFPSLAICANAARSCGHVLDVQARRGRGPLHHPHLMPAVFESAIVLLINVWTVVDASKPRTLDNISRTVADVQNCVNVQRLYERRWRVAGIRGDILSALISLGKPVPVPVSTPTSHPHDSLAQQSQQRELELSAQEPSHLPVFALPIHTEELGQLPIYDSFEYAFNETLQSTQAEGSDRRYWGGEMDCGLLPGSIDVPVVSEADFLPTASSDVDIPSGYSWQDWGSYLTDVNHNWGVFQN
ncbi:fungal-specific transcription factor domain-containing protein [Roridomyces roridus]|uniref:Fungal-specific transcription factor domain-containing protein n=1 Tax=Roridomyces roridus TaxID=1738132 RepID=A0AAD7CCD3_9AGAR|nr:fungal-specific transcription factor domain-containing protein [Roridomyces roridus]